MAQAERNKAFLRRESYLPTVRGYYATWHKITGNPLERLMMLTATLMAERNELEQALAWARCRITKLEKKEAPHA